VKKFCGRCHAPPDPLEAPREQWRLEVEQGYRFHEGSEWSSEPAPDKEAVVAYFESRAKGYGDYVAPGAGDMDSTGLRFTKTTIELGDSSTLLAGIRCREDPAGSLPRLFVCDMREGGLYSLGLQRPMLAPSEALVQPGSGRLSNPCQVTPCDLDADRSADYAIADLGTFQASDESQGRIVWLRPAQKQGFETTNIASGLGRVADVQPGDFDGDGRQDLIVAEFGWRAKGSLILLKNRGLQQGVPQFESVTLDRRHGGIHVPVCDLNRDGHLDFVALISQEHEAIEAFLGNGDGTFQVKRIYSAPHPSWGSTGIQVVDLDSDGDLDVLFSNGDHFDRPLLKPFHAVQWLENDGDFPWIHHQLAPLPGCHRALAGDIDGDGDLDAIAVAYLDFAITDRFGSEAFDSVVWFEQTAPRQFQRHALERGACHHLALEMGDFDSDGDLDLAVPSSLVRPSQGQDPSPASITLWWNETIPATGR
jgi:hypothetical protein